MLLQNFDNKILLMVQNVVNLLHYQYQVFTTQMYNTSTQRYIFIYLTSIVSFNHKKNKTK